MYMSIYPLPVPQTLIAYFRTKKDYYPRAYTDIWSLFSPAAAQVPPPHPSQVQEWLS